MRSFWVIEAGNEPRYWNGRGAVGFTRDVEDAVKFFGLNDAERVKNWICRNHALRTAEHQMIGDESC